MDIIAAHQQGLIEQLEEEAAALAGRPGDHGQLAVVLHHLFDHSRGMLAWALAEARRELRIRRGIAALRQRLGRWGWTVARRSNAAAALDSLATALGEAGRARTLAAYRAYRLSATAALRSMAEQELPPDLLAALDCCHAARRCAGEFSAGTPDLLATSHRALECAAVDHRSLASAWAAIDATGLRRAAHRLLGEKALTRAERRDARRGVVRVEAEFRADPALPPSFRANPAQHFYALQNALAERRRRQWREECDREPDAFELAA